MSKKTKTDFSPNRNEGATMRPKNDRAENAENIAERFVSVLMFPMLMLSIAIVLLFEPVSGSIFL